MSHLLACTDGSLYAASLHQHAAWVAGKTGWGVTLVHVIEREESRPAADLTGSIGFDAGQELLQQLVELDEAHARVARLRGKALLEDGAKQLAEAGVEPVVTLQRHGSLVENLVDLEEDASLVIIGKRGEHADFAKGHIGSNLERVVRSSQIPVLVASRAFQPIQKVLIAFDRGPSALKAVHFAATNPLFEELKITLLSTGRENESLERELQNVATGLRGAHRRVEAEFVVGDPEETIAAEVEARGIDLLVMGAYGHSRIRQLIIGSTTTALLRTCHVPVLLFR
ncbi:MAG: universal stress protein [Verrucomicrobiota bacterium]